MTFIDTETSISGAEPIELYRLIGTTFTYYLTTYSKEVTVDGNTYLPTAGLDRTAVKIGTQEEDGLALDISLPFDHPLALDYAFQTAPPTLSVEVLRVHWSNLANFTLMWKGPVMSFSVEGRICRMRVPSLFSWLLAGSVPSPRYQAPCNHVLFDPRCGVNPAAHEETVTVTAIAGPLITLSSYTLGLNKVTAGDMYWGAGGEGRMIISHAGLDFTVSYPFAKLTVGESVRIRKGCDHAFEGDCKTEFSNGINFGGHPLVPAKNPFASKP